MDKIDIAIIRELTQAGLILPGRPGFEPSYREVSKKLGITLGTVRNRINKLYSSGVLKGSSKFPNPNLLGLSVGAYTIEVSSELKKEVFEKLKLVDGVFSAHDFIGGRAWIVFAFKNEEDLDRKLRLFTETGAHGVLTKIPFPPCQQSVSRAEAELILKLSNENFSDLAELAKEMSTPVRTLKRRLAKIVRENMILSLPIVDYTAISECLPIDILVFFKDSEARKEGEPRVIGIVKDYMILAALWDVVGMCSLILPSVALASEISDKLAKIDGVKQTWAEIVAEHVHQGKVLTRFLEEKMLQGTEKRSVRTLRIPSSL